MRKICLILYFGDGMGHSKSSKQWLDEHFDDHFVKQAKKDGYRSRAVYKLLEIQAKDQLIKPGMRVVELGAAPGGWSQVLSKEVGDQGQVLAMDILTMDAIPGVDFIQGDFREQEVLDQMMHCLEGQKVELVISDMAPNMSGNKSVDTPKAMYLVELAFDFASQVLAPGGCLLVKIFQGEGFEQILLQARRDFKQVVMRKPKASRARSRESYLLAKHYRV